MVFTFLSNLQSDRSWKMRHFLELQKRSQKVLTAFTALWTTVLNLLNILTVFTLNWSWFNNWRAYWKFKSKHQGICKGATWHNTLPRNIFKNYCPATAMCWWETYVKYIVERVSNIAWQYQYTPGACLQRIYLIRYTNW